MRFTTSPVGFVAALAWVRTPFASAGLPPADCPPKLRFGKFAPPGESEMDSDPHRFMWQKEAMEPKDSPLPYCEGGFGSDCFEVEAYSTVLPQDGGRRAQVKVVKDDPAPDVTGIAAATTDPVSLLLFSSAGELGPFKLRRLCFVVYHKTEEDLGFPTFFIAPVDSEDPEKCGTPVDCTNLPEGSVSIKKLFRNEVVGTAAKICVDLEAVCMKEPDRKVCDPIWKFAIASYHLVNPPKECSLLAVKLLDVCTHPTLTEGIPDYPRDNPTSQDLLDLI